MGGVAGWPQALQGEAGEAADGLVVGGNAAQPPVGQGPEQRVEGQPGVGVGADLAAGGRAGYDDVHGLQPWLEVPVTQQGVNARTKPDRFVIAGTLLSDILLRQMA